MISLAQFRFVNGQFKEDWVKMPFSFTEELLRKHSQVRWKMERKKFVCESDGAEIDYTGQYKNKNEYWQRSCLANIIIYGKFDNYLFLDLFSQFSVVDWFCLFIYLWVLTFPLLDCSEFGNFVITLTYIYSAYNFL
jgi:hypothetical protein